MVDIDFGKYPRYDELVGILKGLHEEYPGFTKLYSIGKTLDMAGGSTAHNDKIICK